MYPGIEFKSSYVKHDSDSSSITCTVTAASSENISEAEIQFIDTEETLKKNTSVIISVRINP